MKWTRSSKWIGGVGALLSALFLPGASAGKDKDHPYRRSDVDMPVSLAVGTVRTPEFPVIKMGYVIMIQAEKHLPFKQLVCMMGVTANPFERADCTSNDPLLRADWTVWDEDRIVKSGSSTTHADDAYTKQYIVKYLGNFLGEAGKKYVVEVRFTKDGTPLNVNNPHLIVTQHRNR